MMEPKAGHCVSHAVAFPWSPAQCEQAHFHFASPMEFAFWLIKASFFLATLRPHVTSQKLCELMPDGHPEAKPPLKHPRTENPSGCREELITQQISCPQHSPDAATSDLKEGSAMATWK